MASTILLTVFSGSGTDAGIDNVSTAFFCNEGEVWEHMAKLAEDLLSDHAGEKYDRADYDELEYYVSDIAGRLADGADHSLEWRIQHLTF